MVVLNELRSMFWGVTLDGGKRYTQTVERSFHISMAALEYPSTEGSVSPVSLMVNIDKAEFLLCTLGYGNVLQQPLDLMFTEGEEVTFFLNGSGIVHLTGYLVEDQPEDMSMYSEDISSGDEESDEVPALVGEDSDEDDDDDDEDEEDNNIRKALFEYGKKRKKKDKDSKSKKKMKVIQADEDDDDDDSDDEDFEIEDFEDDDDEDDSDMLDDLEDIDEESSEEDSEDDRVTKSASKMQNKQVNNQQQTKKQEKKKKDKTPKTEKGNKANIKEAANSPSSTVDSAELTEGKKKKKKKKKKKNANTEDGEKTEADTPEQKAGPKKRVLAGGTIAEEMKTGHGPEARPGKMVSVYYVGKLSANGKQFDSCKQGKPFKFRLGKNEVIKGWDLGVTGMKVGGRRRLTVPPQQGYGGQRQGPIPPNSTLVFEVELKAVS